jgi:hypothetical protein
MDYDIKNGVGGFRVANAVAEHELHCGDLSR